MIPQMVKDIRLYNQAFSYQGLIKSMTIPKIVHQSFDYRAGGMVGAVKIFTGIETPEIEWTLGGHDDLVVTQAGLMQHDGTLLRAVAALQGAAGTAASTLECVVRGQHEEIDFGTWEPGKETEEKVKTTCSYYKLVSNGRTLFEIDIPGGVYIVDGVDRWADIRAALDG